jgi:hypothetical protein
MAFHQTVSQLRELGPRSQTLIDTSRERLWLFLDWTKDLRSPRHETPPFGGFLEFKFACW